MSAIDEPISTTKPPVRSRLRLIQGSRLSEATSTIKSLGWMAPVLAAVLGMAAFVIFKSTRKAELLARSQQA